MNIYHNNQEGCYLAGLETAVLIPSYDEGTKPRRAIESLIAQEGIEKSKFAVFIIINATKSATEEVMAQNMLTSDLIRKIWEENPDFNLVELDAYSGNNALEKCNIGIVRNLVAFEAIEHLVDTKRPLIMIDADTHLAPQHLVNTIQTFSRRSELALSTGPTELLTDNNDANSEKARKLFGLRWRFRRIIEQAIRMFDNSVWPRSKFGQKNNFTVCGANMAVRANIFEEMEGFKEIPSGEDTDFAFRIRQSGKEIAYLQESIAYTLARVSRKTDAGKNVGGAMERLAEYQGPIAKFPVVPLQAIYLEDQLLAHIDFLITINDREEWKEKLKNYFSQVEGSWELSNKQLNNLWNKVQELKSDKLDSFRSSEDLKMMISKYVSSCPSYYKIPFYKAVQEAYLWIFTHLDTILSMDESSLLQHDEIKIRGVNTIEAKLYSCLYLGIWDYDYIMGKDNLIRKDIPEAEREEARMEVAMEQLISVLKRSLEIYSMLLPISNTIKAICDAIQEMDKNEFPNKEEYIKMCRNISLHIGFMIKKETRRFTNELWSGAGTYERITRNETVLAGNSLEISERSFYTLKHHLNVALPKMIQFPNKPEKITKLTLQLSQEIFQII